MSRIQKWRRRFSMFLPLATLLVALNSAAAETNVVEKVQAVPSGVEIWISSSKPFPVRAMPPILRIGDVEIRASKNPPDGSLDQLIFHLTQEEFDELEPGAPVIVHHGKVDPPRAASFAARGATESRHDVWDFGAPDLSLSEN